MNYKFTPENITSLGRDEVFVFGSNLAGNHAGGAARVARELFGAIMGQGVGMQGQSYAIPTMQGGVDTIKPYVDDFIKLARECDQTTFYVTRIGCGIAGFTDEQIAPLFDAAFELPNVVLPESFSHIINHARQLASEKDNPQFVAMVTRMRRTYGPINEINAFILSGRAHVGENCFITTQYGLQESKIISIETISGYALDVSWNSHCVLTLKNLSDGVIIPYEGIISNIKLLPEEVANMPLKLYVEEVFNVNTDFMKGIVVCGNILQGTIRMWDRVKIGDGQRVIPAVVGGIERYKKLLEESHYGQCVGILLYRAPDSIFGMIKKGMWMVPDDGL